MKRSDLANVSLAAVTLPSMLTSAAQVVAVAGSLALTTNVANATVSCAAGNTTGAVICTLATGQYIAQAASFTGSVNVGIAVAEDTTGFGACGAHFQGTGNRFGLTTQGGSLKTVTGTLPTNTGDFPANLTGGGC